MTRYEAYLGKDWQEEGLAQVLVVRRREGGSADFGFFLVDTWCLGVKDAFGEHDITDGMADELIDEYLPKDGREPIHPTCAKKLIDGAIAYAERLGFAPHRDYRKARKVLSGLDATLCPTEFTFGRDGKPCFVRGPHDDAARVDRFLAILTARCGEDGFDFVDLEAEEGPEEIYNLRQDLMDWLGGETEEGPRFYELSGMVTALQICPQVVMPTQLLEKLGGPGGRLWNDNEELQEFASLLMQYWNYVSDCVHDCRSPDATDQDHPVDIIAEDFPAGEQIGILSAIHEWVCGFMRATKEWPEAWGDALARPDLALHWELLQRWVDIQAEGNTEYVYNAGKEAPPRTVYSSIVVLARALRPVPPA